jgi:predicted O-methyltransferase YrrM
MPKRPLRGSGAEADWNGLFPRHSEEKVITSEELIGDNFMVRSNMDRKLARLLAEIHRFGVDHDSRTNSHADQMLNITPDTGLFLSMMVQAVGARTVLEVGTSDGYSTLWIADALRHNNGKVVTVEASRKKGALAKRNFERSGLSKRIDLHLEDVRAFLRRQADRSFDLIFLDAERPQYVSYWSEIDRVLKSGCLMIVDNALSPRPDELVDFFDLVEGSHNYVSQILRVGKGEMIALKQR